MLTFLAYFYAADLKGIWNDDAVRLTIANGGLATAEIADRHPKGFADVLKANGIYATQPTYLLLVNAVLRLTRSYSIIPIVTTNLLIYLLSAVGIFLLARHFLPAVPRLLAMTFYLWNGFAMVHVLQVREYPLILCFLVYNTLFFYLLLALAAPPARWVFWLVAVAHCLSSAGAFYTTKWAPFFLWPQAVVALGSIRRNRFGALTALGSLAVAASLCLPGVLSIPRNSVVFGLWDKRPPTLGLLITRFHEGTEHLIIGSQISGRPLLQIYYWIILLVLVGGLLFFGLRIFQERFEIQHLVLTIVGFAAFQIAYFFLREPLSTWPRYFIFYLPYVALFIGLTVGRLLRYSSRSVAVRGWASASAVAAVGLAGMTQIRNNYRYPYVDHGPDFREVYRYLITRVAPRDIILVGLTTNRMALNYYWPNPLQIRLGYALASAEMNGKHPEIWTVSYRDEDSQAYRDTAMRLKTNQYELKGQEVIQRVTIRRFVSRPEIVRSASFGRGP